MQRALTFTVKIALAAIAFYIISQKVNVNKVLYYIKLVDPLMLSLALICLLLSQMISALRMRYYYVANNIRCSYYFSFALYFVGMFYNAILPGGITGDGYKIILMQKLESVAKLTSLRLVISNRASGLFLLLILTIVTYAIDINKQAFAISSSYLFLLTITIIIGYFLSCKILLKEPVKIAVGAACYSLVIQILSVLSAYLILKGIENFNEQAILQYIIIFMISSIMQLLPISIGGAGIRELTFLYGAKYFNIDVETGIAFSIIYFVINLALSLIGILFITDLKRINKK
jgi:uncharacterized membrane protein YbhN (UPF0104 family)